MTRLRTWYRRGGRRTRAVTALFVVAGLAFWYRTSPRASAIVSRIAYALLLALPPVLLIGAVLAIVTYLKPRDPGGPPSPGRRSSPRKR
jgi:hypothetical protein